MAPLRSVNTIDEYIPLLVRSGLVSKHRVATLLSEYRTTFLASHKQPDTITAWCEFLVTNGLLTPWQCEKLRHGQWKGFEHEGYTLVDHLGCDDTQSFYLAKSVETAAFVRLALQPNAFRVDHVFT